MNKGFTLLFGVMVTAFLLAIAVAILTFSTRQVGVSGLGRESQIAFYAADSGVECIRYHDNQGNIQLNAVVGNSVRCHGTQDYTITSVVNNLSCDGANPDPNCPEEPTPGSTYKKFLFSPVGLLSSGTQIPEIQIALLKEVMSDGSEGKSTVTSEGRNTTAANAPRRVERSLKLTYVPRRNCIDVADITFVIDLSGSISNGAMQQLQTSLTRIIGSRAQNTGLLRDPSNRVSIIGFFRHVRSLTNGFVDDDQSVTRAISNMGIIHGIVNGNRGDTNTATGIRYANYLFTGLRDSADAIANPMAVVSSDLGSTSGTSFPLNPAPFDYGPGTNDPDKRDVLILITDGGADSRIDDNQTPARYISDDNWDRQGKETYLRAVKREMDTFKEMSPVFVNGNPNNPAAPVAYAVGVTGGGGGGYNSCEYNNDQFTPGVGHSCREHLIDHVASDETKYYEYNNYAQLENLINELTCIQ